MVLLLIYYLFEESLIIKPFKFYSKFVNILDEEVILQPQQPLEDAANVTEDDKDLFTTARQTAFKVNFITQKETCTLCTIHLA